MHILRQGQKQFIDEMNHDPVVKESQLGSATILSISLHSLEHTIEPFECEEPPRIDRTKELNHLQVMHQHVVIDEKIDAECEAHLRVFTEKHLSCTSLRHRNGT